MSYTRFGTYNAVLPNEGPKVYPINLDFRSDKVTSVEIDFTNEITAKKIDYISGFFADNSQNPAELVVKVSSTGQIIRIPANKQAYMPAFFSDDASAVIETTGNVVVPFFAVNFPVWPHVW